MTDAVEARVKEHRKFWKGKGKVSVIRKGQPAGCVCITVKEPDCTRRMFYYPDGTLAKTVIERPLFTLTATAEQPQSALLQQTEG